MRKVHEMNDRRPMGALESDVLGVLWKAGTPCTPADVLDRLDVELAYTTVMTILTRLWQKGLADRAKIGRSYGYSAAISQSDLVASRMRDQLARSTDRIETMSRFVDGLNPKEALQLRKLLEGRPE
jgi:predicted transcriptional regulator